MGRRRASGSAPAADISRYLHDDTFPEQVKLKILLYSRQPPTGKPICLVCKHTGAPMRLCLWVSGDVLKVGYELKPGDLAHYWLCRVHRAAPPEQSVIDRLIHERQQKKGKP